MTEGTILSTHPALVQGASAKFQSLQRIYTVLSDPERLSLHEHLLTTVCAEEDLPSPERVHQPVETCRRKVYDQTGSLNDSEQLAGEDFDNLYNYFRNIYKEVTEDDIDGFAADFRGSQEEKDEVLQYYDKFKGDMHQV